MQAYVVYESMYGNTHAVAAAVAEGLSPVGHIRLGAIDEIDPNSTGAACLLVVGGPTHVHGMSRASSREAALEVAEGDDDVDAEASASGPGLRHWLHHLAEADDQYGVAFDTRIHKSTILTGSAAKGIAKQLKRHRYHVLVEPESFFVEGSEGPLETGELDRARQWGAQLAQMFTEAVAPAT